MFSKNLHSIRAWCQNREEKNETNPIISDNEKCYEDYVSGVRVKKMAEGGMERMRDPQKPLCRGNIWAEMCIRSGQRILGRRPGSEKDMRW